MRGHYHFLTGLMAAIFLSANPSIGRSVEPTVNPRVGFPMPPPQEIGEIDGLSQPASTLLLSPNGRTLYAGDAGGLITVWNIATKSKLLELKTHTAGVLSMALSPDGNHLVSGDAGGTLVIWDLKSGSASFVIKQGGELCAVAFSPNGKLILAASRGNSVSVISTGSGAVVSTLREPDPKAGYCGVTFLDDNYAVAGRAQGKIAVWDLRTGKLCIVFPGEVETTLRVDATRQWLMDAPNYYGVTMWPLDGVYRAIQSGKVSDMPEPFQKRFYSKLEGLAYSRIPFDEWTFGSDQVPKILNPKFGFVWPEIQGYPPSIQGFPTSMVAADVDSHGRIAVVSNGDLAIKIWDLSRLPKPVAWQVSPDFVKSLNTNQDGSLLMSRDPNGHINIWNPATGETRLVVDAERTLIYPDSLLVQGRQIFGLVESRIRAAPGGGEEDHISLRAINLEDRNAFKEAPLGPQSANLVRVSRSGQYVLVGFPSPGYQLPAGLSLQQVTDPRQIQHTSALQLLDKDFKQIGDGFSGFSEAGVFAATFSPAATLTAAIASGGPLLVFDTQSRSQISSFNIQASDITDFAVTDSGLVVAAFNSGSLKCFDAKAGSILSTFERAHPGLIRSVAVSPNGKMVASLGYDCMIKLWSLPELKPLASFDGVGVDAYEGTVLFLDDGRIAAGGVGGDVRVFEVKNEIDLNRWDGQPSASLVNPPSPQIQLPANLSFTVKVSWGGMWIVDSKSHSVVWGYRLPSPPSTVVYDEKNHELVSTHPEGVIRRWKLPPGKL